MIATSEALDHLRHLLTAAGFDTNRPDPLVAWHAFKLFARQPVDCADDAMLFEIGTFSFTGEPLFHFSLTRQFTREEDGEYAGMEQLRCTVLYQPAPQLSTLKVSAWSYDSASAEEFFARVEAMPEFQVPVREMLPLRAELVQEEV